jgi:hypothetical protein
MHKDIRIYIHTYIHTYLYTYILTHIHTEVMMHTRTHACIKRYKHTHTCINTYCGIHVCIHTYNKHTYIHITQHACTPFALQIQRFHHFARSGDSYLSLGHRTCATYTQIHGKVCIHMRDKCMYCMCVFTCRHMRVCIGTCVYV